MVHPKILTKLRTYNAGQKKTITLSNPKIISNILNYISHTHSYKTVECIVGARTLYIPIHKHRSSKYRTDRRYARNLRLIKIDRRPSRTFPFINRSALNLSEFGVYAEGDAIINCVVQALAASGVDEESIKLISKYNMHINISEYMIENMAQLLERSIYVTNISTDHTHKILSLHGGNNIIRLGVYCDHYFAIKPTAYTLCDLTGEKKYRSKKTSYELIKYLLSHQNKYLTKIRTATPCPRPAISKICYARAHISEYDDICRISAIIPNYNDGCGQFDTVKQFIAWLPNNCICYIDNFGHIIAAFLGNIAPTRSGNHSEIIIRGAATKILRDITNYITLPAAPPPLPEYVVVPRHQIYDAIMYNYYHLFHEFAEIMLKKGGINVHEYGSIAAIYKKIIMMQDVMQHVVPTDEYKWFMSKFIVRGTRTLMPIYDDWVYIRQHKLFAGAICTTGILTGAAKQLEIDMTLDELQKKSGYFIKVKNIKLQNWNAVTPILRCAESSTEYIIPSIESDTTVVLDKFSVKYLLQYHSATFDIIDGFYYDGARNHEIAKLLSKEYLDNTADIGVRAFVDGLCKSNKNIQPPIHVYRDKKHFYNSLRSPTFRAGVHTDLGYAVINQLNKSNVYHHIRAEVYSAARGEWYKIYHFAAENGINIPYTRDFNYGMPRDMFLALSSIYEKKYNVPLIGADTYRIDC